MAMIREGFEPSDKLCGLWVKIITQKAAILNAASSTLPCLNLNLRRQRLVKTSRSLVLRPELVCEY